MNKTIVIDLDGTLADVRHRLPLIRKDVPEWEAFLAKCPDDGVNQWCRSLMAGMQELRYRVVIVTGRNDRCAAATKAWLAKNMIFYDDLIFVRKDGDRKPDEVLKREWLEDYGPEKILFVVDDRQKVVDMWRAAGVVCLQCYAWSEYVPQV